MRQLFFAPSDMTRQQGILLNDQQNRTLKSLVAESCRLADGELACRIASQMQNETDWPAVRVHLEKSETDEHVERLHINLPLQNDIIGQMELYTWRDEDDRLMTGIGTADENEFMLVRLQDGLLKELAKRLISEVGAAPAA